MSDFKRCNIMLHTIPVSSVKVLRNRTMVRVQSVLEASGCVCGGGVSSSPTQAPPRLDQRGMMRGGGSDSSGNDIMKNRQVMSEIDKSLRAFS